MAHDGESSEVYGCESDESPGGCCLWMSVNATVVRGNEEFDSFFDILGPYVLRPLLFVREIEEGRFILLEATKEGE
jgi:hypothetical protein